MASSSASATSLHASATDSAVDALRTAYNKLSHPITDADELSETLNAPLDIFGLGLSLAAAVASGSGSSSSSSSRRTPTLTAQHLRLVASLQNVNLARVVPIWHVPFLSSESPIRDGSALLEQFFCPVSSSPPLPPAAKEFALSAYSVILSNPLSSFSLRVLAKLVVLYPVDELFAYLFDGLSGEGEGRVLEWELLVKAVGSLGAKVANYTGEGGKGKEDIPLNLRQREYPEYLCARLELLVYGLSRGRKLSESRISAAAHLLTKLIQIGLFPQQAHDTLRISFFACCLGIITTRALRAEDLATAVSYKQTWCMLVAALPSSSMQSLLTSLLSALTPPPGLVHGKDVMGDDTPNRALVKYHAQLLSVFASPAVVSDDPDGVWSTLCGILLGRNWSEHVARVAVCWVSGLKSGGGVEEGALITFSERLLEIWASPQHSQNPLVSRHKYITSTLLLTWSYISDSAYVKSLATSQKFLMAMSKYLGNTEPAVRLMGMAVAEEVATLSGRSLHFDAWEGDKDGRGWILRLRALVKARDVDVPEEDVLAVMSTSLGDDDGVHATADAQASASAPQTQPAAVEESTTRRRSTKLPREVDSDDDSLIGYGSSPSSSRAPSPTPSELDEIEQDPTLRAGTGLGGGLKKKKIVRPVYLVSLGELMRPTANQGQEEFQKIEMALAHGEELIRRKRDYGTELEENAADLCINVLGLQDNYDIERFEERRQLILTALVACCPQISAPCLIEQFFQHQWSATQRFSILNSLALGARELAGLPNLTPGSTKDTARIAFPTKRLPPALHNKYVAADATSNLTSDVSAIADGITRLALDKGKTQAEEKVPEIIREKQLRIRKKAPGIVPLGSSSSASPMSSASSAPHVSYTAVAAEYFIIPLIDGFWGYLRDEQSRELRTRHSGSSGYRGAGTGMILDALTLRHFLSSLAVMLHAARHSVAFLRILAPNALELAVNIGSRPVSVADDDDNDGGEESSSRTEKENSVLSAALELSLVVLDTAYDLDSGRTLALENTALLSGVREWTSEIFLRLDAQGGIALDQASSEGLNRVRRAAAGVLLRIEEMLDQWRRSMINL